jgi:hypothetical protein
MKLVLATVIACSLLVATASAAPGTGTCSITPFYVPLHGSFVYTASGLTPLTTYSAYVEQPGNSPPGSAPSYLLESETDASGSIYLQRTTDWDVTWPLIVGPVHVKVFKLFAKAQKTEAMCDFEVV